MTIEALEGAVGHGLHGLIARLSNLLRAFRKLLDLRWPAGYEEDVAEW